MDDWKKAVLWAAQEAKREKREEPERFRRTLQLWPLIAVAVVPFGWLDFVTLDPALATVCALVVLWWPS